MKCCHSNSSTVVKNSIAMLLAVVNMKCIALLLALISQICLCRLQMQPRVQQSLLGQ